MMEPQPRAVDKPFAYAREKFEEMTSHLGSAEAERCEHSVLEEWVNVEGQELLRRLVQDHLDLRRGGTVCATVVGADGEARPHERVDTERQLRVLQGTVTVGRGRFSGPGLVGLHPLDAELNLPEEVYSHGIRRRVAEEAAKASYDTTVADVERTTGVHIPKRQAEELAVRAAADFAAFYAGRAVDPAAVAAETGEIIAITGDHKGVAMRREALRDATKNFAAAEGPRPAWWRRKGGEKVTKEERRHRKRMAMVAAVYTIKPFPRQPEDIVKEMAATSSTPTPKRPRPERKRVWASLVESMPDVLNDAFEEGLRRDPERKKIWVGLSDGDEGQLYEMQKAAVKRGIGIVLILDILHVLGYLWAAGKALAAGDQGVAEEWVEERLLEILRGHSSAVAAGMRRSATRRRLSVEDRAPVDKCADYLLKYREFMRYDEYLAAGLPISTGVIEGACRHLIQDRLGITGARWGTEGAEAVIRLRALRSSGDFDEYWLFHLAQEYQRNHVSKYSGRIPTIRYPDRPSGRRSHLRAVP